MPVEAPNKVELVVSGLVAIVFALVVIALTVAYYGAIIIVIVKVWRWALGW